MKSIISVLAMLALLFPLCGQAQIEVKEITTRPGVTVKFAYFKAANPITSAVLFSDGTRGNPIFSNGDSKLSRFLSKNEALLFVQNGISVLFADIPSDRGTWNGFRNTPEHAQDNAVLVAFLKEQANVQVWAIGHGNGALSAASLALVNADVDGLVLASPTQNAPFGTASAHPVYLAALEKIKQPVLLVQHKDDACPVSRREGVQAVLAAITASKRKGLVELEGGEALTYVYNREDVCYLGHHGYSKVEDVFVKQTADWIKATNSQSR
jgi:dienelactone hydrolase